MAARRKTRAREAQLAFEALSIEGGLLSPDWLSRAAQLAAGGQSEADYRIPKGLNIRDEIGRFWRIAQAHWSDFAAGRAAKADALPLAARFVEALLRDSLGFASLSKVAPVVLAERSYPIGCAALGGRVPVVIAPAGSGLDTLGPAFGDGGRRRSAFGLAQEYLNAADGAMWGLTSDGLSLRIVRDNASLTRPAWIEADLQRVFTEERYADFAALWLLAHETRFGRADQPVTECSLETWRSAGREEGTRAREHLRRGVEDALIAFGQGFLAHPDNQALRASLQSGALSTKDYFNQLLRLVYRLIFLLTVEERAVLHPDGADEKAKALYAAGYSLRRLRERSVKRSAHDRFADLWEATKIVFRGVSGGEPHLGLPALAGIFARAQCPALDSAKLENRALLLAVFKLSWLREDSGLSRVNWRDMGPEELGSVYESLLELVPQVTTDGRQFAFATGGETKGNARKTTGSYYTPDSLVQVLLDSALEPVVKDTIAKHPENPVEALLGLSIVDPACGSGHFLLAAARRLASHVARLQANGTPSAAGYRHALRQVVGRCIYGVDLNPMAVELCKVSLWMEAVEPGLPLTFLNSHIQHGNALLGTTPELMAKGIPDAAWEPIEGDDKKVASALKKRNKLAAKVEYALPLFTTKSADEGQIVARAVAELEVSSDANPDALAKKESRWDGILGSAEYRHQKLVADAWCAAFVWPKQPGELAEVAPTNELWRQLRDTQGNWPALTTKTVGQLADQYRFFHWELQFPHVFAKGGFDVALGNPPWEVLAAEEQEFFAHRDPTIVAQATRAKRLAAIQALKTTQPQLFTEWISFRRQHLAQAHYCHSSGRYVLAGQGNLNSYLVFAELSETVVPKAGSVALVLPSAVAFSETAKEFFQAAVDSGRLAALLDFENREGLFPAVDSRMKFCLFVAAPIAKAMHGGTTRFAFNLTTTGQLLESERQFVLSAEDLVLINPNTRTAAAFSSRRDAELVKGIHRRFPVLRDERTSSDAPTWQAECTRMVDLSYESEHFVSTDALSAGRFVRVLDHFVKGDKVVWPVFEAKMSQQFDHRAADVIISKTAQIRSAQQQPLSLEEHRDPLRFALPRFYMPDELAFRAVPEWFSRQYLLAYTLVTSPTNARTMLATILPKRPAGHSLRLLYSAVASAAETCCLCACANSFVFDYVCRTKIGGVNLNPVIVCQLPVPERPTFAQSPRWSSICLTAWVADRVLELSYTAWDLEPFARDVGYDGPPFRWDPERRFLLRCELDAAFFHLYGLSRDDTEYVMDTFPIVRKNDEKAHGEYRTKRVILEIYDAMAEAARTGKPYQTRLDPPPADSRVAHPESTRPARAKGRATS